MEWVWFNGFIAHGGVHLANRLKRMFWWSDMKRDVTNYVATCSTCQKAKVEHHSLGGLL